jgi:hypothetical protein
MCQNTFVQINTQRRTAGEACIAVTVSQGERQVPQMHLYVPREVAREVKRRAEATGTTVSAYLAELVKREVVDDWPGEFFDEVAGGWEGGALQRAPQPVLESREPLD